MNDVTEPAEANSLPAEIRIFVNEQGVSIPRNGTALDAVRAHSAQLASSLEAGQSRVTDSRGLPLPHDSVVSGGTILRVLPVRESAGESIT